jgi:predicted kinase
MRKWMRERMKRRKKADTKTEGTEPTKAPLQPAYFEAPASPPEGESLASASEAASRDAEPAEVAEIEPENAEVGDEQSSAPAIAGADSAQKKRRRRGRGGRGRGRGREPRLATPAVAAASLDEVPGQPLVVPSQPVGVTAPARPPKGVVVLAIGLPGSGKSSWFKRHNITPLSSDMLRALLFDDSQEQRFQDLVFSNLRSMLKARLIARRPTNYVDATNLTPQERHNWVKLAKDYGYEAQAVFFDVPLEVCLERNKKRNRAVEEEVMRRMSSKLRPPTFEEGFSKLTVVRVKKKDNEAAS